MQAKGGGAEGKNLKGKVVARTEESAEAAEDKKWNHVTDS